MRHETRVEHGRERSNDQPQRLNDRPTPLSKREKNLNVNRYAARCSSTSGRLCLPKTSSVLILRDLRHLTKVLFSAS